MDGYPQYFPDCVNYGCVLSGIFTPTEASAIAVIYTLSLHWFFIVKSQLKIYLKYFGIRYYHCNCLVINWFFDGNVWAMSNADVPFLILDLLNTILTTQ